MLTPFSRARSAIPYNAVLPHLFLIQYCNLLVFYAALCAHDVIKRCDAYIVHRCVSARLIVKYLLVVMRAGR